MSEHKTGQSNWTTKEKELYTDRRKQNMRGQMGHVNIHSIVKDEDGKEQRLPIGFKRGPGASSRLMSGGSNKVASPAFTKKGTFRAAQRAALRKSGVGV